ncbi:MAG: hypothetical protein ABL895_16840 [Cyclobacteriaceae bacterium]
MKNYSPPYDNPLHEAAWVFFNKTSNLDGIIHQTVVSWENKIQKEVNSKTYHMIGTTPITSNDLTSETAPIEETPIRVLKGISREDYITFINDISTYEVGYAISQCYEYFETFLYDILAAYVKVKDDVYKGKDDQGEIRALLKCELKGRNNAKALKMLRKESKVYKKFEQSNTSEINIVDWYAVFSLVRHSITHSASSIKREDYNNLPPARQILFNKLFPSKADNDFVSIKPTYITFRNVIKHSHSHALLIFKGLSDSLKLESFPIFVHNSPAEVLQQIKEFAKNSNISSQRDAGNV